MELITFSNDENGITITIPNDLLKHVAENQDDFEGRVKNVPAFASAVMYELEHNLGSETGLTGFQSLLDCAITEVYESAHDSIKYFDDEE